MTKTRSSEALEKTEEKTNNTKLSKISEEPAKVFLVKKNLLDTKDESVDIQLMKLRNPATEKFSYYAIDEQNKRFYQVMQFNQPHRSFFVDDFVSSDGKFYITNPIDIKFLFIYYIRKYASQKAIAIDQIDDPESSVTIDVLSKFVNREELEIVCDVKEYSNILFAKYNRDKCLAWLSLVTKKIVFNIKEKGIRTNISSAQSANFQKSSCLDEELNENKILAYAWGVIGTYLTEELHTELAKYMGVQIQTPKAVTQDTEKQKGNKRKSVKELEDHDDVNSKKFKIENGVSPEQAPKLKEKVPTTKEKQLAKAASGTKNIMSFFKK